MSKIYDLKINFTALHIQVSCDSKQMRAPLYMTTRNNNNTICIHYSFYLFLPIHDQCIQSGFAVFIGTSSETNCEIALKSFTHTASNNHSVNRASRLSVQRMPSQNNVPLTNSLTILINKQTLSIRLQKIPGIDHQRHCAFVLTYVE